MTLTPPRPTLPLPAPFRSPRRVTVTLPFDTYVQLQQRCDREGRSLSNLAAFLLETSLKLQGPMQGPSSRLRTARPF